MRSSLAMTAALSLVFSCIAVHAQPGNRATPPARARSASGATSLLLGSRELIRTAEGNAKAKLKGGWFKTSVENVDVIWGISRMALSFRKDSAERGYKQYGRHILANH